jgi:hypothetical protein
MALLFSLRDGHGELCSSTDDPNAMLVNTDDYNDTPEVDHEYGATAPTGQ